MIGDGGEKQKLLRYLQSSQCKIPWTSREIREAWDMAQRELDENDEEEHLPDFAVKEQSIKSDTESGQSGLIWQLNQISFIKWE